MCLLLRREANERFHRYKYELFIIAIISASVYVDEGLSGSCRSAVVRFQAGLGGEDLFKGKLLNTLLFVLSS